MQSEVALLPCPFCGGEASLTIPSELVSADCADIYVSCEKCEAEGQHHVVEMRDRTPDLWLYERRDAIAAWNTRTPTPASEDAAGLREAVDAIAGIDLQALASAIHDARWDQGQAASTWVPFADEIGSGKVYSLRIANAVQMHLLAALHSPAEISAEVAVPLGWSSPDLRDIYSDIDRLRRHDLRGKRLRDLLQGAMDMLRAADKEMHDGE